MKSYFEESSHHTIQHRLFRYGPEFQGRPASPTEGLLVSKRKAQVNI